ncbi:hypothetical protein DDT91_20250 [Algoriphagus sp. AK58]|nr:hypothetical protein [Algoriphagus sp. AK58]
MQPREKGIEERKPTLKGLNLFSKKITCSTPPGVEGDFQSALIHGFHQRLLRSLTLSGSIFGSGIP